MRQDSSHRRRHVVIAAGSLAGLEALLALRELAGARVSSEPIVPEPDPVMQPPLYGDPTNAPLGQCGPAAQQALALADDEAAAGRPGEALLWLDAAEAVEGDLPPEYAAKRRDWTMGA